MFDILTFSQQKGQCVNNFNLLVHLKSTRLYYLSFLKVKLLTENCCVYFLSQNCKQQWDFTIDQNTI